MNKDSNLGLEVLVEVGRISNSTQDLQEILNRTIDVIKDKLHIDGCAIYLLNEADNESRLELKASSGLPRDGASKIALDLGKGVTGWVAKHKVTLALSEALQDPRFVYFPEIEEEKFKSMLSVPMIIQEKCIGVINGHTLDERFFSPVEISILETISNQMTGCIRNAYEYHRSQSLLREQTILYEISQAVQSARSLEHRLWIILRGMTMGQAGGFNRAILMLVDEKKNNLQGVMGLGPSSEEEANRIWAELANINSESIHLELTEADKDEYIRSAFNAYAGTLSFPIQPNHNILVETMIHNKPFIVKDAINNPLAPKDFLKSLGVNEFAAVPLTAQQGALGVVLIDNRYNKAPITEAALKLSARIAAQGSWVIENSRLFNKLLESNRELLSTKEQLIQSEKLAALGELSAEVAHEIKNPLVAIGGFARRLSKKVKKITSPNEYELSSINNYTDIIVQEVERMESLLNSILSYSSTAQLDIEECDLNSIVKESIESFEPNLYNQNISIQCALADNLERYALDRFKIKQVLINIIFNAIDSMKDGGILKINTKTESHDNRKMVLIRTEDSGGGIPQETFANIFNPFFTTKESGTGLGLSISRRIVESHGGSIHVANNINQGVTVDVYLPLQNLADYNKKTTTVQEEEK